jgi:transposase
MQSLEEILEPVPSHRLEQLSKEELIEFCQAEQKVRQMFEKEVTRLRQANEELRQKKLLVDEQYVTIKNRFFGKSSEKRPSNEAKKKHKNKPGKKKVQLPSLRYPDAPLIERRVELEELPGCKCCGSQMSDSGMTEDSEFLTVIPAQFFVIRQQRVKYRCQKCHGDIVTTPAPPRIKPGSGYSDEMIIDVALSKYCDLIPIDRYKSIAGRAGLKDIPPQSLIQLTHDLADFFESAYKKIKLEVLDAKVLHADETPHRMLEQNEGKRWYLWGFSSSGIASYYEVRNTRSGDVASELLLNSACEYLISDVYSGYNKAVKDTNRLRVEEGKVEVVNCYCNAHARRKFTDASHKFEEEAAEFLKLYGKIYRLEAMVQKWPHKWKRLRGLMKPLFEELKQKCLEQVGGYPGQSKLAVAMKYFLNNYLELTRFLEIGELPIDNNLQERAMRNPVIGRKTWYGNHSLKGAQTSAIMYTLVESCKLVGVNPRDYFKALKDALHQGLEAMTPHEYLQSHSSAPPDSVP